MMDEQKNPLDAIKLLNIAARCQALAMQAWQEPQTCRIAGRLARNPKDVTALSEAIVNGARNGDPVISIIMETPMGVGLLNCAMWEVSMHWWEEMWNNIHPDQFGQAWEGEDFALMSVWREWVRAMIKACHQGAILAMTGDDYFNYLTTAGESEKVAEAIADWLSEINVGDTPST